jgi:hypothetical protein
MVWEDGSTLNRRSFVLGLALGAGMFVESWQA